MSKNEPRFVGRQGKGRMRKYREEKSIEAELRHEENRAERKAAADALTKLDEELSA